MHMGVKKEFFSVELLIQSEKFSLGNCTSFFMGK